MLFFFLRSRSIPYQKRVILHREKEEEEEEEEKKGCKMNVPLVHTHIYKKKKQPQQQLRVLPWMCQESDLKKKEEKENDFRI